MKFLNPLTQVCGTQSSEGSRWWPREQRPSVKLAFEVDGSAGVLRAERLKLVERALRETKK